MTQISKIWVTTTQNFREETRLTQKGDPRLALTKGYLADIETIINMSYFALLLKV